MAHQNNEQNLKPFTVENAREMGKRGGIASGKVKREKKTLRETLKMCLEMTNNEGVTYRELATLGLIKGAMKGNAYNYETMLKLTGELNIDEAKQEELSKLDSILEEIKKDAKK